MFFGAEPIAAEGGTESSEFFGLPWGFALLASVNDEVGALLLFDAFQECARCTAAMSRPVLTNAAMA